MSIVEERNETTVQPVTRRDVLHRAADLLEEFGWCQGNESRAGDETCSVDYVGVDRFCVGGAVRRARMEMEGAAHSDNPYAWLDQLPGQGGFDGLGPVWNDAPGRTKAEVVAKLREAAEAS